MEFINRSPKVKDRKLEIEVVVLMITLVALAYFLFFNKTPAENDLGPSGAESSANKVKAALQSLTAPSPDSILAPEEERIALEKLTAPSQKKDQIKK